MSRGAWGTWASAPSRCRTPASRSTPPDGGGVRADETPRVVMANLNQEFASVLDTDTLLACAADDPL